MNEELQNILKYLRLWGLLANWDELMAEARRGRFSHERLLKHVLQAECGISVTSRNGTLNKALFRYQGRSS